MQGEMAIKNNINNFHKHIIGKRKYIRVIANHFSVTIGWL